MNDPKTPPPLIDENAKAAGETAGAGWKSCVPNSDHRLVLSAIDSQLNAAKESWKEKNADKSDSACEQFFMKCIDETGKSLKKQLEAVTIPADEAEAESALDSFQTRLLSAAPPSSTPISDSNLDDESLSSVDDEDEEIEFDDNDIIDQDAYKQLKQLRNQAREYSSRVISIREETAGRALDMTRQNLSELLRVHGFSEHMGEDESEKTTGQTDDDYDTTEKRDSLNPMHIAIQTLTSSLQHVDSGLAEKLESLKETIGTIDSSIEKYQRVSQGDESALSQTEKALLASDQSKEEEAVVESTEEDSTIYPDKTLARLLAGVL